MTIMTVNRFLLVLCGILAFTTVGFAVLWLRAERAISPVHGGVDGLLVGIWSSTSDPTAELLFTRENRYYIFKSGNQYSVGDWFVDGHGLHVRPLKNQDTSELPEFGIVQYSVNATELRLPGGWFAPSSAVLRRRGRP